MVTRIEEEMERLSKKTTWERACMMWACAWVLLAPAAGVSQPVRSVSMIGGVSSLDLSGTATGALVSLRASSSLERSLVLEGAFAYLPYASQGDDETHVLLPEMQTQVQLGSGRFRPYLGLGVGVAHSRGPVRSYTDLSTSAAGGTRIMMNEGWAIQGEVRLRSVDPWAGSTFDLGVGLSGLL